MRWDCKQVDRTKERDASLGRMSLALGSLFPALASILSHVMFRESFVSCFRASDMGSQWGGSKLVEMRKSLQNVTLQESSVLCFMNYASLVSGVQILSPRGEGVPNWAILL